MILPNQKGFSKIILVISVLVVILVVVGAFFYLRATSTIHFYDGRFVGSWLSNYDLSSDGKHIVFQYIKDDKSNIYESASDGTDVRLINNTKNGWSPKISPDNSRILFRTYKATGFYSGLSYINILNTDGSDLKQIEIKDYYVTEAIWGEDNQTVYFLGAGTIKNYSPVYKKMPHDIDIYSLDLKNSKITSVTNIKAYGMENLSLLSDNKSLSFHNTGSKDDGVYIFSGEKLTLFPLSTNVPLSSGPGILGGIIISSDRKFAVYTTQDGVRGQYNYDLYKSEEGGQTKTRLTSLNHWIGSPKIFGETIFFLYDPSWPNGSGNKIQLMRINLNGSDLEKIDLSI